MQDYEKRAKTRLVVTDEVLVRDRVNNLLLGKLANIHEEGFMVIGSGAMLEDHVYEVQLDASNASVRASAECLWTSETGSGENLWAGFTFLEVQPDDQEKLRLLVKLFQP